MSFAEANKVYVASTSPSPGAVNAWRLPELSLRSALSLDSVALGFGAKPNDSTCARSANLSSAKVWRLTNALGGGKTCFTFHKDHISRKSKGALTCEMGCREIWTYVTRSPKRIRQESNHRFECPRITVCCLARNHPYAKLTHHLLGRLGRLGSSWLPESSPP